MWREKGRKAELHRVLPDEPPPKRPTQKVSPKWEECEFLPQSRTPPSPLPSTSTSRARLPSPSLHENLIDVPEKLDFGPVISSEVTTQAANNEQRCSVIDVKEKYEVTVMDTDSDIDSDNDNNSDNNPYPTLTTRQIESLTDNDRTPEQVQILQAENRANDKAIQELLPEEFLKFDWSDEETRFTGRREKFTGVPGPTFSITETTTPTDIFHKMFEVEFINALCDETNRFARRRLDSTKDKLPASSLLHHWLPAKRKEMITFLAVMILQGLYPVANEKSYFTHNGFGTMPFFSKIMTYNRYLLLKTMLHFVDNSTESTNSRLFKIQPVLDYFNRKFASLYYPQQEIVIDDSLLKWKDRLRVSKKINTKAARVSMKSHVLCDSTTGYHWQFRIYAGKNSKTKDEDETEATNATAKIVFDLIRPLLHRGHTLIMDSLYNCPLLARCLKLRQTDCYGTQRLNREFIPPLVRKITKTHLRPGEMFATYCPDLSLMVWRDANIVTMISTYHPLQIGKRNECNRTTFKPSIVLDYNKSMAGVDHKDKCLSAHPIERVRGRVWYKKLFRRLFNVAVFNCYVLFHTKNAKTSHRQFRTILAEDLLRIYRDIDLTTETRLIARKETRRIAKFTHKRPIVEGNHFPLRSAVNRGRCWWCAQNKVVTRSSWQCMECGVFLCIVGCFINFHRP